VKHAQLARDVRFLTRSALDDTLFCEDMALIEHLFARAQREVPVQIRQLMRAPLHIEHLLGEVEARAALRDFDALRTFLHEEQVTPPLAVASDGSVVGFLCDEWEPIHHSMPTSVTPQRDDDDFAKHNGAEEARTAAAPRCVSPTREREGDYLIAQ